MKTLSVTYASAPSADLLIPTLEFKNEAAGVIRLRYIPRMFFILFMRGCASTL